MIIVEALRSEGQVPSPRRSALPLIHNNKFHIIGGYTYDYVNACHLIHNDIYCYNFETSKWEKSDITPPQFALDGYTISVAMNRIFIIGGSLFEDEFSIEEQQVWELNLETNSWIKIKPTNLSKGPKPRVWHTSVSIGNIIYMFGGRDSKLNYYNDVWGFNIETLEWIKFNPSGTSPSKRAAHCCTSVDNRFIYIFGGRYKNRKNALISTGLTHSHFCDIHCLDTENMTWSKLESKGDVPSTRASAVMVAMNEKLFIYGGYTCTNHFFQYFNDCYEYDLKEQMWKEVQCSKPLPKRASTTFAVHNNSLLIFGGEGILSYASSPTYSSDLFKIDYINVK